MKTRKFFLFGLTLLWVFGFPAGNIVHAELNEGLVAHYPLNGNANDESGNGNDGTVYGASLTGDRISNPNSFYSFDGLDNNRIELPVTCIRNYLNGETAFTATAWVFNNGLGDSYRNILRICDSGSDSRGLLFRIGASSVSDATHNKLEVLLGTRSYQNQHIASLTDISTNSWTFLAVVYDGSKIWLYIDGEAPEEVFKNGIKTANGVPQSGTVTMGDSQASISAFNAEKSNGNLEDVSLYSRALSPAELQQLYVSGLPPGAAILILPSGTITTPTPTYIWRAVSKATWYWLYVNDSTGNKIDKWYSASDAGCSSGTGTCSVTPPTALAAGGGQWWVETWNSDGYGTWSSGFSFNLAGVLPGRPTLISPSGPITTPTPTYRWSAVSNGTWYWLYVNDSTGNKIDKWYSASDAGCASGTGTCSVTPSIALAGERGEWWVDAWNSYGYGPWSSGLSFNLTGLLPGRPTPIWPSGPITTSTPTYRWNAVSNATWYCLYVNDSTGNKINKWYSSSDAGCASGTGTCSVTPSTTLAAGSGQWWVDSWNSYGYGPWSYSLWFTAPADLSGQYTGTWTSYYGDAGGVQATISQNAYSLSGTLSITSTSIGNVESFAVSGTVSGNHCTINGQFFYDGHPYIFYASGNLNGNILSGTYSISGYSFDDDGVFYINRP